jgi:ABC-type lipoprotein release transport system permease subunit
MLLSYLRVALRNLFRNKLYSIVNILCFALVIAMITVSLQTIRAAQANPAEVLRQE